MGTSTRLISSAVLLVLLEAGISSAAIVPITGVNAGASGKLPYLLGSITVGDFTITNEFLALGKSSGHAFLFSNIRYADDFNLNRGVARIAGTAAVGAAGNLGIAGHRDGFFRGLKDVAVGDRIQAVVQNLRALGVRAEELEDGMEIEGTDRPLAGRVESFFPSLS